MNLYNFINKLPMNYYMNFFININFKVFMILLYNKLSYKFKFCY